MIICLAGMFTDAKAQTMADDMQLVNNVDVAAPTAEVDNANLFNILLNNKGRHTNVAIYSADDIRGKSGSMSGGRIKLFSNSRVGSSLASLNLGTSARTTGNLAASNIAGSSTTFTLGAMLGNGDNDTGGGTGGTLPPPPGWLDPNAQITPIGEGFLPLLLGMIGYIVYITRKKNDSIKENK